MTTLTIQPGPPCAANPDLWFSPGIDERALAVHICRSHCPQARRATCAEDAARHPSPESVMNGVAYDVAGEPFKRQPQPASRHCVTCGGFPLMAGDHRKPPEARDACGTVQGWRKHDGRGERKCDPCQEAYRQLQVDRRARNRAAAGREQVAA
jgi:hypothetical protein